MRNIKHQEQQGYVTFAINSAEVDYLKLAYLQALNIKATQRHNKYAVIVDPSTEALITDEHRQVFDYIITCEKPNTPFEAEWKVFWLTPFKETIKLESDLLFTRSIDHWWDSFRLKDVCLSHGCKDFTQRLSDVRMYRTVFDRNNLPDVYNGLMYFRYSATAQWFFAYAGTIFKNWESVRDCLIACHEDVPSTDLVYAIVASIFGPEHCCIPTMDINFVHMKPGIQHWPEQPWTDTAVCEQNGTMIRINNINQLAPVHYYQKDFATDEQINYYRTILSSSN